MLTVRQEIVDRIAAWTATIDPDHQDFCIQQDVFGSQKTARFTEPFGGGEKSFYRDWGQKPVWLHPSPHQWERCVTKLFVDGAKGIAVLPVSKKDPWFWAMGEVVIDWVDIPIGTPLFVSGRGKVVRTAVPYRICLFDVYGREPSHSKTHTQPTVNSDDDRTKDSQDMLRAMPSAEDLMSEVCSTSDSDSQDMDEPQGTGPNRRHRRLLRIMQRKKTEQQVSSDEGSPGPGNSSESQFESSSAHQHHPTPTGSHSPAPTSLPATHGTAGALPPHATTLHIPRVQRRPERGTPATGARPRPRRHAPTAPPPPKGHLRHTG